MVLLKPSSSSGAEKGAWVTGTEHAGLLLRILVCSAIPLPSSNKLHTDESSILPKQDGAFIEYGPERLI